MRITAPRSSRPEVPLGPDPGAPHCVALLDALTSLSLLRALRRPDVPGNRNGSVAESGVPAPSGHLTDYCAESMSAIARAYSSWPP